MRKRSALLLLALALVLPAIARAQGNPNFSGTWKLAKIDPPTDPRNGRPPAAAGGGGAPDDYGDAASVREIFGQTPQSLMITQTANQITVKVGPENETYTLDNKVTVTPATAVNALKTWAHWNGTKLHLHFKKGMNWGRDILSMNGGQLTVVRDIESNGGSAVFTMTYSKGS
jgi:hypothetical protein